VTAVTVDRGQQNGSRAGRARMCEKVGGGGMGGLLHLAIVNTASVDMGVQ